MSEISDKDVAHLAHLSRLSLSNDEIKVFSTQIKSIVDHMESINELDTNGLAATIHPAKLSNHLRNDEINPYNQTLTSEQALKMAPVQEDDRFRVPQILAED